MTNVVKGKKLRESYDEKKNKKKDVGERVRS